MDDTLRQPLTAPHVAYLKIADGCDRLCSFCAIPAIRGRFVSKPLETIVGEARKLAENGVKELVLIAQETTFYGSDLYGKPRLAELLERLETVAGIRWIRLMYAYPLFFGDELLERFAAAGTKLLPYIDMPLQHANDTILKRMRRGIDRAGMEALLERLRSNIPNLVLRTSLIVGFPGETEAMFDELVAFVKRWRFDRAGIFPFSSEAGTVAARLDGHVPQSVIDLRFRKLQNLQRRIMNRFAAARTGKTLDVLIDGPVVEDDGNPVENVFVGRTYADAPEVDPLVYVTGHAEVGAIVPCEIVDARDGNLIGVVS